MALAFARHQFDMNLIPRKLCSYTENYITEQEFNSLPPRLQEQVKRIATNNQGAGGNWPGMYYNTPAPPNRYKRVGTCGLSKKAVVRTLTLPLQIGCGTRYTLMGWSRRTPMRPPVSDSKHQTSL